MFGKKVVTAGPTMLLLKVKVAKLHEKAIVPTYATVGSACFDFYACEDVLLRQDRVTKVPTGLSFDIPEGYFLDIRPRSGMACEGVVLVNSPATIDSDYRGEVLILLRSLYKDWRVYRGNRIAQGRIAEGRPVVFEVVAEALPSSERGAGGFGSTGR